MQQALAEARMPDEPFRPWWEAVQWIAQIEGCSLKDAFIKLCGAVGRGDLQRLTATSDRSRAFSFLNGWRN